MGNHDWTTFTKRINIKSDKAEIFNYWITQENIEKWFLSSAKFCDKDNIYRDRQSIVVPGDQYTWMWHGSADAAHGEVILNNGIDALEFSFLGCMVKVQVKTEHGENIVELTQSEIALDEDSRMNDYMGCSRGWTFYLTNLKSILEGGIDLRNKNINLKDVINT